MQMMGNVPDMQLIAILSYIRIQDIIDILFLTVVAYHLYLWFKETKAFKALVGLAALGIIYTVAQLWGLFLTTWMFQILWQVLVILLIILFQSEIRQVLERMNPIRIFGWRKNYEPSEWIQSFSEACFLLARKKIGALIILERTDNVEEWITDGIMLEGVPGHELLLSIFQKESLLHDGAILIRGGHVVRVGGYLPLSSGEDLPKYWGTRHRAGIGVSERCDAWVVVISEERMEVSLARSGKLIRVDSSDALSHFVEDALKSPVPVDITLPGKLKSLIVNRWRLKLETLGLVSILWLLFAGQQDFEVTLQVALATQNLPAHMEVLQPLNPRLDLTIRGLRKDASTVDPEEVNARIDLTMAGFGRKVFRISPDQIILPNEQVKVVRIDPSEIFFEFKEKQEDKPSG